VGIAEVKAGIKLELKAKADDFFLGEGTQRASFAGEKIRISRAQLTHMQGHTHLCLIRCAYIRI